MDNTQLTPLRIGVRIDTWSKLFGIYTQSFLKENGIESHVVLYHDIQELANALMSAEVSICPAGLKDLPTTLPEGTLIAALSARNDVRQCLVLPKTVAEKADLTTLKGLKIWGHTAVNTQQLQALFPDVTTESLNLTPLESLEAIRNGQFDGGIMTLVTTKVLDMHENEWFIQSFSPREFVPEAGQGVISLIAATDDLTTRRLLKKLHNPKVVLATNVERTLKKMFNDTNIAAYCERDKMHNYHFWAAAVVDGTLRKVRLSQSTTLGLADRAKTALLN